MRLIDEQREDHSVVKLCSLLKIDPGSYYRHCREDSLDLEPSDQTLAQAIRESYKQSREIYGRLRIHEDLRKNAFVLAQTYWPRLMKQEGIEGAYNEPGKTSTTTSVHIVALITNHPYRFPVQTGALIAAPPSPQARANRIDKSRVLIPCLF